MTSIYQTKLCNSPTYLTLTWSKNLYSHSLTIYAADSFSITLSLYPSTFSFFRNRPGFKSIYLTHHHYQRIKLYWDFTRAEFSQNLADPHSSFYIAVSSNGKLEFFLGDLQDELIRRSGLIISRQFAEPVLLSRRELVFGRKSHISRVHFLGTKHEIGIEYSGGILKVKVDGETSVVVKRLAWKFRKHERIHVDGIEVDLFWDGFNWVNSNNGCVNNGNSNESNGGNGHGFFIFQVGGAGVWLEMVDPEKRLMKKSLSLLGSSSMASAGSLSQSPSCSSVLQ
ncbi:uncharacterized protein LOC123221519 [Mangifera indica]|uniref:uncharacterized protein LOC123221519 n=1 Tax=Mangifera indica TaxID=29780 RepID=UPI001CFB405A|nr:uncharacterized protein LOC123221519 [Mangifera indica]